MRVDRFDDPVAFWRATQGFLERDELGNAQLLAVGARHAREPVAEAPVSYVVSAGDEPAAAAILLPKGTLLLSPADPGALRSLHDVLSSEAATVTDVVGEAATAQAYARINGHAFATHIGLRLYRLQTVTPVSGVAGALRPAGEDDFELLCRWQQAFVDEIEARNITETPAEMVRRRLDAGGAWLWEVDGVPVAHAGHRPTPVRSARIAPVYTLPDQRGRGYAAALVAKTCNALLVEGCFPLYLFADVANPVANGVYRRVGFEAVGEHLHLMRAEA